MVFIFSVNTLSEDVVILFHYQVVKMYNFLCVLSLISLSIYCHSLLLYDRYMVVISEDDIICRGCANLMNTLDRLETEMGSVRNVVLRFLEKKYALEEGELLNNKMTGFCPPPPMTSHNASLIQGQWTCYEGIHTVLFFFSSR
jgi:hypothetical protein